jgi:hypothetical protein
VFFFEKKNQKTFACLAFGTWCGWRQQAARTFFSSADRLDTVFLVVFCEKKQFLLCAKKHGGVAGQATPPCTKTGVAGGTATRRCAAFDMARSDRLTTVKA